MDSPAAKKQNQVRLTANITPEVAEALKALAERRNTTMTDILQRAITLEKFAADAVDEGGKLLVEDKRGKIKEVLLR